MSQTKKNFLMVALAALVFSTGVAVGGKCPINIDEAIVKPYCASLQLPPKDCPEVCAPACPDCAECPDPKPLPHPRHESCTEFDIQIAPTEHIFYIEPAFDPFNFEAAQVALRYNWIPRYRWMEFVDPVVVASWTDGTSITPESRCGHYDKGSCSSPQPLTTDSDLRILIGGSFGFGRR